MKLTNKEVIQIFKEAEAAMQIKNFSFFKLRAYQNAITVFESLTNSIYDIWENKKLDDIPGIGQGISAHLNELFTTGKVKEFDQAKFGLPEGMFSLLGLRGIGAKKAFKLANAFKLVSRATALEELLKLAKEHKISELEGFGDKSEADILEAIDQAKMTKSEKPRMLLTRAEEIVDRVILHMKTCEHVLKIECAGSFRRRQPTVADLDFIVSTSEFAKVIQHFLTFPEIEEIIAQGDKKVMVLLKNDVQCDLRMSEPQAYGALIQYNTGNTQHNINLRTLALKKGLSLSEYGIKKGSKLHEFADEQGFYKFIGLPYLEPELRQGNFELERAQAGTLPNLITLADIKGDIHTHTIGSDGANTLGEMVEIAVKLGYEYYGVSDHAPSVINRGEQEVTEIIDRTRKQITALNQAQDKIKVLFGYEVNILADMTMALPDELMKKLDYVIGSVHTAFNQDRATMTRRIISALENPYVNVLGHPSGRLIGEREPVEVDWSKVFDCAVANNKVIEINSQPNRLDLTEDLVREALEKGVKIMINTDAHDVGQLANMKYGIDVARRAWCGSGDVLNCLKFTDFAKAISLRF